MTLQMEQRLKQTQRMMLSPQIRQAIELLYLTHMEIKDVVSDELTKNPVLEETDHETKSLSLDWRKPHRLSSSSTESTTGNRQNNLENIVEGNLFAQGKTLAEHLEWQLRMESLSPKQHRFALNIIYNLNDEGFLATPLTLLAQEHGVSPEEAIIIQKQIQKFDPLGCGSETLSECLLAQMRITDTHFPLLEKIVDQYIDQVLQKDYKTIAKKLGVSIKKIDEICRHLKDFHPRPGLLITDQPPQYIIPDVYVVKEGDRFVVKVNNEGVPDLKVSRFYRDLLSGTKTDKETCEYLQNKVNSALWFIKSLKSRQKTIYNVAKTIVVKQQDFFKKGAKYLRPMILRDVAEEIQVHDSTVSRVTTNKYMHTHLGIFEMKYFFNVGVGGRDKEEDVSNKVVRLKIQELIDEENPKTPLSDQKIATLLGRADICIARRTVAKYRESLGILPSAKRKVFDS